MVLHIDSSTPQYFKELESVFLEFNQELVPFFFAEKGKLNGKKLIVKLEDVSPEEAYLPQELLPTPKDGFYDKAILGFSVFNRDKGIGVIEDVIENASQNLFVIEKDQKEYLVPAVEAFIQSIDHTNKNVYLDLPDGLLDL